MKLCLHFTPFAARLSEIVNLSRYIVFLLGKLVCFMQPIIISYPICPDFYAVLLKLIFLALKEMMYFLNVPVH